jgi:hypothetical protein
MRPTDSSGDNSLARLGLRVSLLRRESTFSKTSFHENSDIQQWAVRNVQYNGKTRSVFEFLLEEDTVCSFVMVLTVGYYIY